MAKEYHCPSHQVDLARKQKNQSSSQLVNKWQTLWQHGINSSTHENRMSAGANVQKTHLGDIFASKNRPTLVGEIEKPSLSSLERLATFFHLDEATDNDLQKQCWKRMRQALTRARLLLSRVARLAANRRDPTHSSPRCDSSLCHVDADLSTRAQTNPDNQLHRPSRFRRRVAGDSCGDSLGLDISPRGDLQP